jgi:hypothetical protein
MKVHTSGWESSASTWRALRQTLQRAAYPADAEPDPNDSTRVLLRYPIDVATIRLSDESEVTGTLTEICRGVTVLLDELQSDFGEDDALELR